MEITWYSGEREGLLKLFELAEDSPGRLAAYLPQGRVLVATDGGEIVGHLQLVESGDAQSEAEVLTMAVVEERHGEGVGRALVERAIAECRAAGIQTLVVATATASTGNLRFYQRLGFRMDRIERDAFTSADGYPEDITVEGIPLRDRVWLTMELG
jgi:predicted N-acetyltransferase YhbS